VRPLLCFRKAGSSYEQLVRGNEAFTKMMREGEHLILFSERGLKDLLVQVGSDPFSIEPNLFPYDAFLVPPKTTLAARSPEEIASKPMQTPRGRLIQAFLDINERLQQREEDRDARLLLIQNLARHWSYRSPQKLRSAKGFIKNLVKGS
jgi:hypothetical protein